MKQMKNKYVLNIGKISSKGISYTANDKARQDVNKTLHSEGWEIVDIFIDSDIENWKAYSLFVYLLTKFLIKVSFGSQTIILIQYPAFNSGIKIMGILTKILSSPKVVLLIHDIDSLRRNGSISKEEIDIFNKVSELIVHTESMKEYLINAGVFTPMKVLWLFDYHTDGRIKERSIEIPYSIVFAGNLLKSEFLYNPNFNLMPFPLYLYGKEVDFRWGNGKYYRGKFAPDNISEVLGDWGLVWDGVSINSCDGDMGEYLKYNSSHKVSLYLAARKPIIVWRKSGLAKFVEKNNVGICIDSLNDIPDKLRTISIDHYKELLNNVDKISNDLHSGAFLKRVVD